MKRYSRIPVLTVLTLLTLASAARAETLKESFSKTWPLAANGAFSVKNVNGDVTIEAWDRAEVQVHAEKQVKADDADDARKIMSQLRIDVQASPSALRIETRMPKREDRGFWESLFGGGQSINVTYRVRVPRGAIVETDTTNGNVRLTGTRGTGRLETTNGNIDVEGTSGALALQSTNGNIEVVRSEGALKASTTNGNVQAELTRIADDRDLGLSSTNGGVIVRLPRDARLSVDAATTNGSIDSDLELSGGRATRKHLTGDLNGGGGLLRIRTTNGSVQISER